MIGNVKNNKRIAKNTIFLNFRMLAVMGVSLYTYRIVLQVLGVVDLGVYNVVGGVVTTMAFLSGALASANSRFITISLGKDSLDRIKQTVSGTKTVQFVFALFILIVAETVGLWFISNKLVIPAERFHSAFWVYQLSIISCVISIMCVPYNALIIAHEKMKAFAYISIFEALAKLGVAFAILYSYLDKLILYAALLLVIQLFVSCLYVYYCRRKFDESLVFLCKDITLLKEIFTFAGWNSIGYMSVVGYTEGINILLNIYFGPAVNAARAVAVQAQGAIRQFCINFQMAVNPQIIKSYAQGDYDGMHQLLLMSTKFSFYIMLLLAGVFLINVEYVMTVWLKNIPEYAIDIVRIILFIGLIEVLKHPIICALQATGNIKSFQIIEGSILLSILPLSYFILKFFECTPTTIFMVYMAVEFFTQIVRVLIILPKINLKHLQYLRLSIFPICVICFFSTPAFLFLSPAVNIIDFAKNTIIFVAYILFVIYLFGITNIERTFINSQISALLKMRLCQR